MIKEIKYSGYTAQPSDYESPDGDLALSVGLVPENGSMRPVMPPKVIATFSNVHRVFVHKNNFTHYIVVLNDDGKLTFQWCDDSFADLSDIFLTLDSETIADITAIGNMLVVASSKQMYYVLWKDGAYTFLANSIPDIDIAFALNGQTVKHAFRSTGIVATTGGHDLAYEIANTSDNYTAVMAIMNSFVNQYSVNENRFLYPFFIRYALKLYDGTYAHISDPIFMVPNSGYAPWLHLPTGQSDTTNLEIDAYAVVSTLQMRLLSAVSESWSDIIAGVDIFVSQPIYPYAQGESFNSLVDNFTYKVRYTGSSSTSVTSTTNELEGIDYANIRLYSKLLTNSSDEYKHQDLYQFLIQLGSFGSDSNNTDIVVQIAPKTEQEIRDSIVNTANFYLIHSLDFNDILTIDTGFKDVDIKKGTLKNLVNKKALSDELLANRTLVTANLYAYNNRLHAFNAQFQLPAPKGMLMHNNYVDTLEPTYDEDGNVSTISTGNPRCYHVFVFLHTSQGTKVVHLADESNLAYCFSLDGLSWFYYPDNNAYRALFVSYDQLDYIDIQLTRHDLLNGAYWLADSLNDEFSTVTVSDKYSLPDVDNLLLSPSSVYVSEVNNPFTFLSSMAVSVGCNKVFALATAAKPLSTGQFGQFPLYAFTDNGVWSLETSATGSYVARQPVTRDICTNVDSICQLESSVLFATDRGIMELSGSEAGCITDNINTLFPFSLMELPQMGKLIGLYNDSRDTSNEKALESSTISVLPFSQFLAGCRIVNDYAHQRIIVYNPDVRYAYVFSRLSSQWGMMQSDSVMNVNSYPQAQTVDEDGNLLDYGATAATAVSVLLVSRPFAMGAPDIHKTVSTLVQRGFFRNGNLQQVLFASNDLFNWLYVGSSSDSFLRNITGSPYKFFRVVVIGKLQQDEALYGLSADYVQKFTDQLR